MPTARSKALASLLAVILIWAGAPIALKHLTTVLDPWTVNGLRYLVTALFWLPLVLRQIGTVPDKRALWRAAAVPAGCHLLGQIGWGLAPYYNDAGVMNFVSRIGFLFTALAGFLLLRSERALARKPLFWVGSAAALAGLLAMFFGGHAKGSTSPLGMGILIATSACWSLYAVTVRLRMAGFPVRLAFGVVSLLVAPGLTLLMFTLGDWQAAAQLTLIQWALVAGSALLGIALGHVLFYQAVHTLGPVVTEGALAVIPFLTVIAAAPILGEHMTPAQWLGGSLLVAATLFLLAARFRASSPARGPKVERRKD